MIKTTPDGALSIITLARPEKANALNKDMLCSILESVEAAVAYDETRVILLTGEGSVFSAGADLEATKAGLATDPIWEAVSGAIADATCLTIAALNGTVAGGAMGMVLAVDIRIAVPDAKFFYPVMKLGFLPQPSDPARLAALVGPARAKLILMGGAKITASEAYQFGLIDQIDADPVGAARQIAQDAQAAKPSHVAAIKKMIPS